MLRSREAVYHSAVAQNHSVCHFRTNGQTILATLSNSTPVALYNLKRHSEEVRRSKVPPELNWAHEIRQSFTARGPELCSA